MKEEADRVHKEGQETFNKIISEAEETAQKIISDAENEKSRISEQIRKSEEKRDSNIRQAIQIIEQAKYQAKQIAGEAYYIAQNAKKNKELATAMKNIIEGYGDEYIKPTYSLLDELASEFGYTEVGKKFKDAREISKALIQNGKAATCEYIETTRRKMAINFVLDAFNGKADSILSRIKKDNHGKLKQELKDAYSIVNYNGSSFRNARITEAYLQSKMDELKWGSILHLFKLQEKEEQRKIREQMREEERARKEYEKAIKEAEKEEELIRKAMKKATEAMQKATEEQKAKYEEQLRNLEEKLKAAEEKNQRALSMAQQTKSGYVYVISNIGSFGENVYKIGMTRRLEPMDRVRELGDASVPFPFDVHAMIYSEDAPSMETELHRLFIQNQVNKVNPRKEFFRMPISEIREALDKKNLDIAWTIKAEATEYRETLAIERAIDNGEKESWTKFQQKEFAI